MEREADYHRGYQVTLEDLLRRKDRDLAVPGFAPSYSPAEADACGAFEDPALEDELGAEEPDPIKGALEDPSPRYPESGGDDGRGE